MIAAGTRCAVRGALTILGTLAIAAAPAGAQDTGSNDPVIAVQRLFDAMRAKDTTAMRALFHPAAQLFGTTVGADGQPRVRVTPIGDWLAGVARASAFLDERLSDVDTRVSGGLATVWATYDFYVDGTFSHCGVDAFQLAHTADGWKIIQVADTRQREGCDPAGGE